MMQAGVMQAVRPAGLRFGNPQPNRVATQVTTQVTAQVATQMTTQVTIKSPARWATGIIAVLVALAAAGPAHAAAAEYPRWGSIKAEHANMHVGPGFDYRVKYIYQRKGLPVKVLRAMGGWWLVEDPEGARGWVLQRLVSHGRTGMVKGDLAELHEHSDGGGRLLWRVRQGVIGKLDKCSGDWCRFSIDARQGWVNRKSVWGAVEL